MLIGVGKLREFVHSILLTAKVKNSFPVSTFLIAKPERGKTSIVLEPNCKNVIILTDVTGKGLQFVCQMNSEFTHFVVNDLAIIAAHSHRAQQYFFSMLNAVLEEGIRSVAGPQGIAAAPQNGRRGMIGCIPSDIARDNRTWWHKRGIARRIIPFHYEYPDGLILKIKSEIDNGTITTFSPSTSLRVPEAVVNVTIPTNQATVIRRISDSRAEKLGQLGISLLKNYRALAQGHALLREWRNAIVTDEDTEFLKRIDPYVDWKTPALL